MRSSDVLWGSEYFPSLLFYFDTCDTTKKKEDFAGTILYAEFLRIIQDVRTAQVTWKWGWIEYVLDGQRLANSFRKIQKTGYAMCIICSKELKYGIRETGQKGNTCCTKWRQIHL